MNEFECILGFVMFCGLIYWLVWAMKPRDDERGHWQRGP